MAATVKMAAPRCPLSLQLPQELSVVERLLPASVEAYHQELSTAATPSFLPQPL